jgi:hypothetical protein
MGPSSSPSRCFAGPAAWEGERSPCSKERQRPRPGAGGVWAAGVPGARGRGCAPPRQATGCRSHARGAACIRSHLLSRGGARGAGCNIGREAGPQTAAGGCTIQHHGSDPGSRSPQPWQDPARWHALLQLEWKADAGHAAPAGPLACLPMLPPIEAAMLIYWLARGAAGDRPAPFTTSNPIRIRFPPNSRLPTRPAPSKALPTILGD